MAIGTANNKDKKCPLLKKACIEHECKWYIPIRGKAPQSEEYIDRYDCAIAWLPMLLVENSQMQRQTGAAVESFRNEMVEASGAMYALAVRKPKDVSFMLEGKPDNGGTDGSSQS